MNKREAAQIITVLQINYPDSFKGKTDELITATVNLWASIFRDDAYQDVNNAVMAHMSADTNRFMPPVGVIKARLVKMQHPDEMSDMEAWGYVSKALRNGIYGYTEEFEKLPPVIRRIVGTPMQLREWAMMDSDTVQSVVMSGFRKSYAARAESEREFLALPSDVREIMTQIASGMAFPALGEGR